MTESNWIKCVLYEPANKTRLYLRRYFRLNQTANVCPGPYGYHNAKAYLMDEDEPPSFLTPSKRHYSQYIGHPLWPTKCEHCDYQFTPEDEWQIYEKILFQDVDTKTQFHPISDGPVGMMWEAPWYASLCPQHTGADKRCFLVMTPGGVWEIDRLASDGTRWSREGQAPNFTCLPSIKFLVHGFHAFLEEGWLKPCPDSNNRDIRAR